MHRENRPRLFGTNGVRGIFGKQLTDEVVIDLCYSLATYFEEGAVMLGYDGRPSSPVISRLVSSTLNSGGLDVGNTKLIPTPCLQYAVRRCDYQGGIMITASHNPPCYNGIKPVASDGIEISREDELKVEEIYYSRKFSKTNGLGNEYLIDNVIQPYIEAVVSLVNVDRIRSRGFKIVMDMGNGVQALVAPYILSKLGCKVITINGDIDGSFPGRGSEPNLDNLGLLSSMVKETNADFGVAYDGDGDRSIFCDEKGIVHPGDKTGALLVRYLLRNRHKHAEIVCPINTTVLLSKVAQEEGSSVTYTKVGSVEVSREMVKRKSTIGLEENGGFMYGKLNEVRDGAMTTALVLDMLTSDEPQSLSQMISSLPQVFQFKSNFECKSRETADEIVLACLKHGSPMKIEKIDGAKIWFDRESWLMVRPSGTEPLVRLYAESFDQSLLDSKVREYSAIIMNKTKAPY
jgi:phosphomannomutase/phosphoglucomutase